MRGGTTVISSASTTCPLQFGCGRQSIAYHSDTMPWLPRTSSFSTQEL